MGVDLLDNAVELGRRFAAARGYTGEDQATFGRRISRSDKTVGKIEKGDLGAIGRSREDRRQLAERIQRSTGLPSDFFGLSEPAPDELAELRQAVGALATLALTPNLGEPARQLLESELAAARQWSPSTRPTEEQEPGEASG